MLQRNLLMAMMLCASLPAFSQTLIFQTETNQQAASPSVPVSQTTASAPLPNNTASGNSELFFMLEQLQLEVRELRGIVEEQSYTISQMQARSKDRYRDLDARILDISKKVADSTSMPAVVPVNPVVASQPVPAVSPTPETKSEIVPASKPSPTAKQPASPEQKKAYREAYDLIKAKQFESAIDKLHEYIELYPEGDLTGNAYYWLGEVYLVLPKLDQSQQAFKYVVAAFPGHRKVADALYKLGVTFHQQGDISSAKKYFEEVRQQYPDSSAAKLASDYLNNL